MSPVVKVSEVKPYVQLYVSLLYTFLNGQKIQTLKEIDAYGFDSALLSTLDFDVHI